MEDDGSVDGVLGSREQFRRYRKRRSSLPARGGGGGVESQSPPLDFMSPPSVPKEASHERYDSAIEYETPVVPQGKGAAREKWSALKFDNAAAAAWGNDRPGRDELETKAAALQTSKALVTVKPEPGIVEDVSRRAEETYARFALPLYAALREELVFPELMCQFEVTCHELAESVRDEATERHRLTEERLMRQTAQMLQGEAGTWSLLWHLYGKETEEMYYDEAMVFPPTSQQEAALFILANPLAQQCLRIVQWLEGLASKELDYQKKRKGWYAGSYVQKLGVWHQTQQAIRKRTGRATLVKHLDPDAPSRERAHLHPEDQELQEDLLEDVWKLLRAGRLAEARELCRRAGQTWRAPSIGGCGELGPSPSFDIFRNAKKDRVRQAMELESGFANQRRLWKWASFRASEEIGENAPEARHEAAVYAAQCGNVRRMLPVCFDWESACWAMTRSWLDTLVDSELFARHTLKPRNQTAKGNGQGVNEKGGDSSMGAVEGPHSWPQPVLEQQPQDLVALFQNLHSGDLVHESVHRSCKEQQRLLQMDLMIGDFSHLLDLLKQWTVPHDSTAGPHGHPQMVRFGAHLVIVLRNILIETADKIIMEKLQLVGDLILNAYLIFLFTEHQEEYLGLYASQLAPHLCVELYANFMDLRQNDNLAVKYKIFCSAIEFLPFFSDNTHTGCVSDILDRVLIKSREVKAGLQQPVKEERDQEVTREPHQLFQSSLKAQAVQWLCFSPPPSVADGELLQAELLARALEHCNLLFREFALISLWRTPTVPAGPHNLLSHLAGPLKQPTDVLLSLDDAHNVKDNLQEFEDWKTYYECDALYRSWLKMEQENAEVPPELLSIDEKQRAISAAQEALDQGSALLYESNGFWLAGMVSSDANELTDFEWLEVHVTAVLMSDTGAYLAPEATLCTALSSSLFECGGDSGVQRQLTVDVQKSTKDGSCVDVQLRCVSIEGDGVGTAIAHDGGLLGSILALAAKGELPHFQAGLILEVVTMDAWYWDNSFVKRLPAVYILQGLCRRCCLPELILRCLQLRVFLAALEDRLEEDHKLIDFVSSRETALYGLFSQRQLQEFLLLEAEVTIRSMEFTGDDSSGM
ncbi:unnamed protein product [Sphagnum compactum]